MSGKGRRHFVCVLDDILDGAGVAALIDGEQVALLRMGEEVFALENRDPFSDANVMARGLVGDLQGQLVVSSPVYKQHFNLRSGRCLEDETVSLRTWPCGVLDGRVWVEALPLAATGSAATASEPMYRINVQLAQQAVNAYGESKELQPGMSLEAEVSLERRRLVEWVIEPIQAVTGKWHR